MCQHGTEGKVVNFLIQGTFSLATCFGVVVLDVLRFQQQVVGVNSTGVAQYRIIGIRRRSDLDTSASDLAIFLPPVQSGMNFYNMVSPILHRK
jgi:hypothetical protein